MENQNQNSDIPQQATQPPVPTVNKPGYDPAKIYPEARSSANLENAPEPLGTDKPEIEKSRSNHTYGVTVMAVITILSATYSLIVSSTSGLARATALIGLLLGIGLFFRNELVRKIVVWMLAITIILSLISVFMMVKVYDRAQNLVNGLDSVSQQDKSKMTASQKRAYDTFLTNERKTLAGLQQLYNRAYVAIGI